MPSWTGRFIHGLGSRRRPIRRRWARGEEERDNLLPYNADLGLVYEFCFVDLWKGPTVLVRIGQGIFTQWGRFSLWVMFKCWSFPQYGMFPIWIDIYKWHSLFHRPGSFLYPITSVNHPYASPLDPSYVNPHSRRTLFFLSHRDPGPRTEHGFYIPSLYGTEHSIYIGFPFYGWVFPGCPRT